MLEKLEKRFKNVISKVDGHMFFTGADFSTAGDHVLFTGTDCKM